MNKGFGESFFAGPFPAACGEKEAGLLIPRCMRRGRSSSRFNLIVDLASIRWQGRREISAGFRENQLRLSIGFERSIQGWIFPGITPKIVLLKRN
ncbi:MAG: hypothetical protein V3S64_03815, partial [bacterium]